MKIPDLKNISWFGIGDNESVTRCPCDMPVGKIMLIM
jgi:hypothetical protein